MQHTALSTSVFLKDFVSYEHHGTIIMSNFSVISQFIHVVPNSKKEALDLASPVWTQRKYNSSSAPVVEFEGFFQ